MATSVATFLLQAKANSQTIPTFETTFTPPSNIAGEHCYVECTVFAWDYVTAPSTAINTRDCITLSASWAQSVSAGVSSRGTFPSVTFASIVNNFIYSHGPILCYIPDGPQQVTFTVQRTDENQVVGDTTSTNTLFVAFKMVNASSRQPPIGV